MPLEWQGLRHHANCIDKMSQADGAAAAAVARGALVPSMQAVPVFEASPAQEWRGHEKARELVASTVSQALQGGLAATAYSTLLWGCSPFCDIPATCPTRAEHNLHDIVLVVGSQSAEQGRCYSSSCHSGSNMSCAARAAHPKILNVAGGAVAGVERFRFPGQRVDGRRCAAVAPQPPRLPARVSVRPRDLCQPCRPLAFLAPQPKDAALPCPRCTPSSLRMFVTDVPAETLAQEWLFQNVLCVAHCMQVGYHHVQAHRLGDCGALPPDRQHPAAVHICRWQGV
jgi:hypothetical protein